MSIVMKKQQTNTRFYYVSTNQSKLPPLLPESHPPPESQPPPEKSLPEE